MTDIFVEAGELRVVERELDDFGLVLEGQLEEGLTEAAAADEVAIKQPERELRAYDTWRGFLPIK